MKNNHKILILILIVLILVFFYLYEMSIIKRIRRAYTGMGENTDLYNNSFKNNNPGNIKWFGQVWFTGESSPASGGGFAQFDTVQHGVMAIAKQLCTDYYYHGLKSISQIVSNYAPASDGNDTNNYIKSVTTYLNNIVSIDSQTPLPDLIKTYQLLPCFVIAIVKQEQSVDLPLSFVNYCLANIQ